MVTEPNVGTGMHTLDKSLLLKMYEQMLTIRHFEERAGREFAADKFPGFVHLYAGEEAVAVGVCTHLTDDDFITSHHRGHGHCIAKGVDVQAMVAELLGREAGACRGKGGSMHIADVHKGMLGANGIVGGGFPLAVGAGLTARTNGKGQVAVCFFGDGACNQGTFHEGLNLAGIWKLPVIFVAENNGYAESTPVTYHMSCRDIADGAAGYGMPGVALDGLAVVALYEAASDAGFRESARRWRFILSRAVIALDGEEGSPRPRHSGVGLCFNCHRGDPHRGPPARPGYSALWRRPRGGRRRGLRDRQRLPGVP